MCEICEICQIVWYISEDLYFHDTAHYSWYCWYSGQNQADFTSSSQLEILDNYLLSFLAEIHEFKDGPLATDYTLREKKGTKTVPLGYHCYKWYPISKAKGHSFFLRVPYYGQSNSAPRGTLLVPFFSKSRSVVLRPFQTSNNSGWSFRM